MGRSPCCDKAKVKKGPWSAEEDALLINFFAKFGNGGNWISLPKRVGLNRCGKSCRLRWLNYLRPNIKHGSFTQEEDHIIYSLYNTIGSRWSKIASNLPGRTDNEVKNYWNTKLKRKILSGEFLENHIPSTCITTNYNSGVSSHMNTYYSPLNWQTLGNNEKINTSSKFDNKPNYNDILNMGEGDVKDTQSYISSSSVTPEISSYSGSSSSMDINQSSSYGSIMSINSEIEDEFWMDLLSDSFEDVVVGSQLEEKISEIASLLDDSFSC